MHPAGELRPRAHAELGVDVSQMTGDRPLAEEECGGHFPVRSALGDQGGDAALGRRQPLLAGPTAHPAEPSSVWTVMSESVLL